MYYNINTNKLNHKLNALNVHFLSSFKNGEISIPVLQTAPSCVCMPQVMAENYKRIKNTLNSFVIPHRIYFAHKCTKQSVFVREAKRQGLDIDVASEGELNSALSEGFHYDQIEATGPKSENFLIALIRKNILIQIDSIQELKRIIILKSKLGKDIKNVRIGIRIGGIHGSRRNLRKTYSRFGIDSEDFTHVLEIIEKNSDITLQAIHFHSGRISAEEKAGLLPSLIDLLIIALDRGHHISEFNIGGGFRDILFCEHFSWSNYIVSLEESLRSGEQNQTWNGQNYGLQLSKNGTIIGRGSALSKGELISSETTINVLLNTAVYHNQSLATFLRETDISLAIEPGYSLLSNAGLSFFNVIESKKGPYGNNFVVLGGSSYDIGKHIREYLPDPILLSHNSIEQRQSFQAYITGILCREEDVFLNRKVFFESMPEAGEIICFPNTAAYRADFEDIRPHLRKENPLFFEAQLRDASWLINECNNSKAIEYFNNTKNKYTTYPLGGIC